MVRNFNVKLDQALASLNEGMDEPDPQAGTGDPTKDPALASGMKTAEKKAAAGAQANAPAQQPGQAVDPGVQAGKQAQDQKAQAEQQKKQKEGLALGKQMNTQDKEILMLQAKVTGGAAKPADIAKLNTLLTAKKGVQDQFMKTFGVPPV